MKRLALLPCLVLLGCGDAYVEPDPVSIDPSVINTAQPPSPLRPELALSEATPRVADPKLNGFAEWPLIFDGKHLGSGDLCTIRTERAGEVVRELSAMTSADACTAIWDGLDSEGNYVSPGRIEVVAELQRGDQVLTTERSSIEVVRVGVRRVQLQSLTRNGRQPLLYRAMDGMRDGLYEVEAARAPWHLAPDSSEPAAASVLDLEDGTPRDLPETWTNMTTPPVDSASPDGAERDTYNLPTAWIAGTELSVVATFSTEAAGDETWQSDEVQVRALVPDGLTVDGSTSVRDGQAATFVSEGSPVPGVGRYDIEYEWRFEARVGDEGEWVELPGMFTTEHRLYGLARVPVFDYDSPTHGTWVDVVDQIATWMGDGSSDMEEVAARIVSGVYLELGLRYDTSRGASHYTSYPLRRWEGAVFNLASFQDRRGPNGGSVVNCSDAASIVSTYANMVGLDFRYHILQHRSSRSFQLNYLRAIGSDAFRASPFDSGRAAFSYHAVVGPEDGRIFDSTLAIDGDGTPASAPHELLLVQGLTQSQYLAGLSPEPGNVGVRVDEQVRIQ